MKRFDRVRNFALGLMVPLLVTACGRSDWKTTDDVEIISESESPNGEHFATVYFCSGGGAAGYTYTNVNLRKASDAFNQRDFLLGKYLWSSYADISVSWTDSTTLNVSYRWSSDQPEYKKQNGQRISEKDGVKIVYLLKEAD